MATTPQSQSRSFYRRLAQHAELPFVTFDQAQAAEDQLQAVNPLAAQMLSENVCRHFQILAVSFTEGVVTVATSDPFNELARDVASALTGRESRFVVAAPEEIERAIDETFAPAETVPQMEAAQAAQAEQAPAERGTIDPARPDSGFHLAPRMRLGDLLVERGLATEDDIQRALEDQERIGSRLGEVLLHSGVISESELVAILAEQFQLPHVDVSAFEPDPAALELIPEPLARRLRVVPVGVDDTTLYVAAADVLDDETVGALREHTSLELRGFLAERSSIDELLQRLYGQRYVETARSDLLNRFPEESANRVVTGPQKVFFIVLAVVFVIALVITPLVTLIVFMAVSAVFYLSASLYKFRLVQLSLGHPYEITVTDEEIANYDERRLPVYTILVPLYKEGNVVPKLARNLDALDYPKTKLDVRLLCEEDDDETVDIIKGLDLPPHFKLIVVPDAQPKTKPKACNYGLLQAEGEYVVIYDAEDQPDPDQLKKVAIAFDKGDERVVCIQAKLNYFNAEQNLLTRWFATEYSMWFDLLLPGLDKQGVPIPLGGTSNSFKRERLIELGAWDPFNVTEDADLGIRLHKAGDKTAVIDSTTLEEANSEVQNWINQRSRWIKGYFQTWLVHMRHPFRLMREIGPKSWFSFQMMIGGTAIFLLNPIFWMLTTVFLFTQADQIQSLFPSFVFYAAAFQLVIGNFIFMYLNVAGAVQRGYFSLAKYALISPLYWGLMSIAAWKGFIQLFTNPFYWEKTVHGLDGGHDPAPPLPPARQSV